MEIIADDNLEELNEKFAAMNERFDQVEAGIAELGPLIEFHVEHQFTPGLYSRKIFMPAGSILTSKIHKTEHQFVVLSGAVTVWDGFNGTQLLAAPFNGITKPGTRRILICHTDVVWITFHATEKSTPEEVEEDIILRHVNDYLTTKEQPCLSQH